MDLTLQHGGGTYTLRRDEALRYLGYAGQEIDSSLNNRIEEIVIECETISRPAWVYRIFPVIVEDKIIRLDGCTLVLEGRDIHSHLCDAQYCAVMAATCGLSNERELLRLNTLGGVDALIFDAAGSALVEAAGDACNAAIVAQAHEQELFTNYRYGPGYGDFSLDIQGELLRVINADKYLGMSVTETNMLVPTKSITAFVGLFDTPQDSKATCTNCSFTSYCTLRQKGQTCYR